MQKNSIFFICKKIQKKWKKVLNIILAIDIIRIRFIEKNVVKLEQKMSFVEKLGKKKTYLLVLIDVLTIAFLYIAIQFFVRDTFRIYGETLIRIIRTILIAIAIYETLFKILGLYKYITRFENGKDYMVYAMACASRGLIISILNIIFDLHLLGYKNNIVTYLIIAIVVISYRVLIRYYIVI